MTMPRLAPGGVGRGCFMPCAALCWLLYGVLERGNIGALPNAKTALRVRKWPLRRSCLFGCAPTWWTRAQKMPPAGRGRSHKRREAGGKHRDIGKRKPAPGKPRAGAGGIQDFFAVSQIMRTGSSRINRIIKRCTPSRWGAPRRASSRAGRRFASGRDRRLGRRVLAGIA